ncbi:heterokaryon incompatibility het-6 [Fusarium phyllophilum]|uniref:Heterokaryon incompatibility het-6 n=1 Tax=Fusarium phyllophilum TaxID=47803 RepID=A0A8H5K0L4_9HYPO|nr:heterokaryon incompatibility het-6 [Fusarium phyllophilum]
MPRWHKETCSMPRVVITGNTPRCEACDSAPDIEKYINQQRAIASFTQPPPDPPLGQLNLRWPSSVKYQQQPTKAVQLDGDLSTNKQNLDVIEPRDNKTVVQSPIYASRLGKDEFRLLLLSPSTNHSTPIHAELVVHEDGRSPQYESTSYTWAGENGDSSKCRPLYIGRYWDVVLQTQNCWFMLQSLRLPIGTRAIWVDAICINQNDIEERDSQVMKMSQMYKNCHRVVVYLGPDMATFIPAGYPAQKELVLANSELSTGMSPDSFRELLCRRYFSRIRVVQELVLAKRVAFQIGDSEYWMNSTTMRSLETHNNWDWNSTTAPWLQNLCLERLQEKNILHILRATQMCQCADPRDRIFGILSLLSNNSADSVLRADYYLSFREMVIGLFSHTLLELRDLGVLRFAAGLRNYSKFPSWMPDLSVSAYHDSSQNGLRLASCQSIVGDDKVHQEGTPWYLGATVDSSTGALCINLIHLLEFQSSPRKMKDVEFTKGWHPFSISGRHSNLVFSSNLPLDKLIVPTRDHLFCLNDGNGPPIFLVMSLEIDNNIYKILGICRHVAFQDQKLYLGENTQQWNAYETHYPSGENRNPYALQDKLEDHNLHLKSLQYTLHTQLEAINTDDTSTNIWADNPSRFSSLKATLNFGRGSNCTLKPILMSLINKHAEPGFLVCLSLCIPTSFRPQVEVGKYIVVTVTEDLYHKLDSIWWKNLAINWRFVGQACFESGPDKDCSCRKAFDNTGIIRNKEQHFQTKRKPRLVDLLSKYPSREEDSRGSRSVSDHCMLWQDYTDPLLLWPDRFKLGGGLALQIRVPKKAMERRIKQTMAWKTLHRLNRVSPIPSEDDLDAVLGSPNPNPDFRSIAVPGWPTELVDDFNIDGSVQRVRIQ